MKDSQGTSQTKSSTPAYSAGVIGIQVTNNNLSKERAQRLYAIGELKAAAQVLSELAAGKHFRRATDRWEPLNG
jgi:hypothetical protein